MSEAIEDLLAKADLVRQTRDVRRIEVPQALAAVADEITKQTTLTADTVTVDAALTAVRDAVTVFKPGDDIETVKSLFKTLFEAEGVRLIDVTVLQDAVAVRIKETGEADIANVSEDVAIADFTNSAHDYQKEA